jgi:hypothetical protein
LGKIREIHSKFFFKKKKIRKCVLKYLLKCKKERSRVEKKDGVEREIFQNECMIGSLDWADFGNGPREDTRLTLV